MIMGFIGLSGLPISGLAMSSPTSVFSVAQLLTILTISPLGLSWAWPTRSSRMRPTRSSMRPTSSNSKRPMRPMRPMS